MLHKNPIVNDFIFLILGAAIALLLINKCGKDPVKPQLISPQEIEKQVVVYVDSFKVKYDSLFASVKAREVRNSINKSKLSGAQYQARIIEKKVDEMLFEVEGNDYAGSDLQKEMNQLALNSQFRDSLCNSTVNNLELIIGDKDSMMSASQILNSQIRISLDTALANYQRSLSYNKQVKKEVTNVKAGSWIWKGAAAIATFFYLREKLK